LKAAPFEYARAARFSEFCALLATHGRRREAPRRRQASCDDGDAAGAPGVAGRYQRNRRAEILAVEKDMARTGACTRQCVVERDHALAARVPLLRQALAWWVTFKRESRTVGGSSRTPILAPSAARRAVLERACCRAR